MRSAIRKELLKSFVSELTGRLPRFERLSKKDGGDDPTWAWELDPKLTLFICLVPFGKKDTFAVEVGWADGGRRFPWDESGDVADPSLRRAWRRLSRLWASGRDEPTWQVVPEPTHEEFMARIRARAPGELDSVFPPIPAVEDSLARVPPLVSDAVDKLIEYALPLFKRVAAHHGVVWPDDATHADE